MFINLFEFDRNGDKSGGYHAAVGAAGAGAATFDPDPGTFDPGADKQTTIGWINIINYFPLFESRLPSRAPVSLCHRSSCN